MVVVVGRRVDEVRPGGSVRPRLRRSRRRRRRRRLKGLVRRRRSDRRWRRRGRIPVDEKLLDLEYVYELVGVGVPRPLPDELVSGRVVAFPSHR